MGSLDMVWAKFLDGVRATPRRGTVRIHQNLVEFTSDDAPQGSATATATWPLERLDTGRQIAAEFHLTIRPPEDAPDEPPGLLITDPAFATSLTEARRVFQPGLRSTTQGWLARLSLTSWIVIAALVIPLTWWAYSALLPKAHILVSRDQETRLGDAIFDSIAGDWETIHDDEFDALLARMVSELKDPDLDYDIRVSVVRDDTPNAFAAPGGQLVIFSGLLDYCSTPDTLAAVLAHEIVHAEERHGLKHIFRTLGTFAFASGLIGGGVEEFATAETIAESSSLLMVLKHSREHEHEADRLGVAKLQRARRKADGLIEFFNALSEVELNLPGSLAWISTHPMSSVRTDAVRMLCESAADIQSAHPKPWLELSKWRDLVHRVQGS